MATLAFKPADVVPFAWDESRGSMRAELSLYNAAPEGTSVVFKIKTNTADRYIVKPHIGVLRPKESRVISFTVQAPLVEVFKADMARQEAEGRKRTAFLILGWALDAHVSSQLEKTEPEKLSATLQALWHAQETHNKSTGASTFASFKFAADMSQQKADAPDATERQQAGDEPREVQHAAHPSAESFVTDDGATAANSAARSPAAAQKTVQPEEVSSDTVEKPERERSESPAPALPKEIADARANLKHVERGRPPQEEAAPGAGAQPVGKPEKPEPLPAKAPAPAAAAPVPQPVPAAAAKVESTRPATTAPAVTTPAVPAATAASTSTGAAAARGVGISAQAPAPAPAVRASAAAPGPASVGASTTGRTVPSGASSAESAAPRGATESAGVSADEVIALRQKFNDLAAQAVMLRGERDGLSKALQLRERELENMRTQIATLERQVEEARSGLRLRKPADDKQGAAAGKTEEDDDLTREVVGFPLWQVVVVALVMFLVGYLANVVLGA